MRTVIGAVIFCCVFSDRSYGQFADSTNMVFAEGKVLNAATGEPVNARITYQSLPYGNRIGVINNSSYSFPMFDGEHYSITVEAPGFSPAKYMLDPTTANEERKVTLDISLSDGGPAPPRHKAGEVLRLTNLIFAAGNAKISAESYEELDRLAGLMKENPDMVIQLEGHTDYIGSPTDNLKLSQRRVDAVRSYLAGKGIPKSRMKTKAFGGSQPLSREDTPEAHQKNRRVEVRILAN